MHLIRQNKRKTKYEASNEQDLAVMMPSIPGSKHTVHRTHIPNVKTNTEQTLASFLESFVTVSE
jgi:hypothetical protein